MMRITTIQMDIINLSTVFFPLCQIQWEKRGIYNKITFSQAWIMLILSTVGYFEGLLNFGIKEKRKKKKEKKEQILGKNTKKPPQLSVIYNLAP